MAAYMKSQAPYHMVTVGEEGFFGPLSGSSWMRYNPNDRQWKHVSNLYQQVGLPAPLAAWRRPLGEHNYCTGVVHGQSSDRSLIS